ncbi:UNVERIFIED_CONTAM: hypothetical protein PYX00_010842 [Menopon gallinae]|uniref:Protein kinase domain-containing protein n=1 Tax=Menopon gallinae TaxID=328185 RepID=A0AAW2H710_9NEOP
MEVTDLVQNSQKLLESIKKTLKQSDFVTDKLTKNLSDIESALDLKTPEREGRGMSDCMSMSKKRSKSVARSRFERRFSSEDVLESKSRTASSSLDRSGQWSRLAAMLESAPVLSEATVREWAAEMFVALETLHRWGVTCRDLHPGNILLDESGHLLLTFQLYWRGVDSPVSEEAVAGLYAAPETTKIFPVTPAADWWSYGALLFRLLTGKSLSSCYPGGIFSHTIITFPEFLSPEACSLLTELLRYDPTERLGGGVNGSDDIKCHPFFSSIDWQVVYECL